MSQCSATSKRTGLQCRSPASAGAAVCAKHGAKAPQVRKAAARRLAEARVRTYLTEQGVVDLTDPIGALTRLMAETLAFYEFCRDHVGTLAVDGWEGTDDKGGVQLSVYVELLERAQDRAHRMLSDFVRLGLEERMVRLTEAQTAMLLAVVTAALADPELGLSEEQRDKAPMIVARHIDGGK